jgi:hypothetical protein
MTQDRLTPEDQLRRFIEEVHASGTVWGLRGESGWAFCESGEYEETDVLLFWSDRAGAQQHVKDEWSGHLPTEIPLEEFVDKWLPGMDEDQGLLGLNWDAGLDGPETEPSELAEMFLGDDEAS